MGRPIKDITGQRFGKLIALEPTDKKTAGSSVKWKCKCDCGNITNVMGGNLQSGVTTSCGCLHTKHGMCCTPEYSTWSSMISRCNNPKNHAYHHYGGRGITVCDRWLQSFENFYADMGPRPSDGHSIDRRDNDGNYEPSNCRWATSVEQNNNTSRNVNINYKGKEYTINELVKEYGISYVTLHKRIYSYGWSVERAIETTVM